MKSMKQAALPQVADVIARARKLWAMGRITTEGCDAIVLKANELEATIKGVAESTGQERKQMSNAARKARKRSGEPLKREPKVGTPLAQRTIPEVWDANRGYFHASHRALNKRRDIIKIILMDAPEAVE